MATTPSRLKLSCKVKNDNRKVNDVASVVHSVLNTPNNKHAIVDSEGESSPVFFPLTQESNEDIDVLWDWHSPQTSHRRRKKQKRLLPTQSPKFPLKRYPSNNQNQNFERLRNELKALQEELAVPDDESVLCVSPQQEQEFKMGDGNNLDIDHEPLDYNCDDNLFNDSIDDQLVLFSQKAEQDLFDTRKSEQNGEKTKPFSKNSCDNYAIEHLINKYSEKNLGKTKDIKNDSINLDLSSFGNDFISRLNTPTQTKTPFQRTVSEGHYKKVDNVLQTVSGKLEFHRTRSFEMSTLDSQKTTTKCSLEEIERKRLEALAKLESKKKKENALTNSPVKCSPEEIEKKRLQALAKLEAKRIQDMIEKKRQEALKKLQLNRMKNASQVKSTLSKRL